MFTVFSTFVCVCVCVHVLCREWQMERSFQTAVSVLHPEMVFILGDIFDEGKWSTPEVLVIHTQAYLWLQVRLTCVTCP